MERNNLLQIIAELHLMKKDLSEINDLYSEIMERVNKLYVEAPATSNKALRLAEKALKDDGEYSFTEEEIDRFLPEAIRGKIKNNA